MVYKKPNKSQKSVDSASIKNNDGFTIVELLIVIVVIAILAAISIVAYNDIQQRANNTARIASGKQFITLFQLYKATFGSYPPQLYPQNAGFCLGTGFPLSTVNSVTAQRCRSYNSGGTYTAPAPRGTVPDALLESDNTALMTELKKVGSIPGNPIPTRTKQVVGPYTDYDTATPAPVISIVLDGVLPANSDCGGGFRTNSGGSTTYNHTYCSYVLPD